MKTSLNPARFLTSLIARATRLPLILWFAARTTFAAHRPVLHDVLIVSRPSPSLFSTVICLSPCNCLPRSVYFVSQYENSVMATRDLTPRSVGVETDEGTFVEFSSRPSNINNSREFLAVTALSTCRNVLLNVASWFSFLTLGAPNGSSRSSLNSLRVTASSPENGTNVTAGGRTGFDVVGDGEIVGVALGVRDGDGVGVELIDGTDVRDDVAVAVDVELIDGDGFCDFDGVGVIDGVTVLDGVGELEGTLDGAGVGVLDDDADGVGVGVLDDDVDGVGVGVRLAVGDADGRTIAQEVDTRRSRYVRKYSAASTHLAVGKIT